MNDSLLDLTPHGMLLVVIVSEKTKKKQDISSIKLFNYNNNNYW